MTCRDVKSKLHIKYINHIYKIIATVELRCDFLTTGDDCLKTCEPGRCFYVYWMTVKETYRMLYLCNVMTCKDVKCNLYIKYINHIYKIIVHNFK